MKNISSFLISKVFNDTEKINYEKPKIEIKKDKLGTIIKEEQFRRK